MSRPLFGECLSDVVGLSNHDVAEILEDQAGSRRRFGEIALSWGLCRPEDVWQAWCHQLNRLTPEVDLQKIGIDAQAAAHLPKAVAREFCVMPIRSFGNQLVVAAARENLGRVCSELPKVVQKDVKFVVASRAAIERAIEEYYAPSTRSAAS
jgi:type IV pilus assembly protein PilB